MKKLLFFVVAIFLTATSVLAQELQDSLNTQNTQKDTPSIMVNENTLNVYPNPSSGRFTLYMNSPEETFSVIIYDIVGKELFNVKDISTKQEVEFDYLEKGLYFYTAVCKQKTYCGKILIR